MSGDPLRIEQENEKQEPGFPASCTDAQILSEVDSLMPFLLV
jgi:hypothetical protein